MKKTRRSEDVALPVVAAMKAESKSLGQEIATLMDQKRKLDEAILALERKEVSNVSKRLIQQHHPLPKSSPFYGLALPEAATKQLNSHTTPVTARELWSEMEGKYPTANRDPANAVHWGLRRREQNVGDVVMVGDGKWAMAALYSDEQLKQIRASRGPMAGRDREAHIAKTKAGAANAVANGAKWGAPKKMTPELIAKIRNLIKEKMTVAEICAAVNISAPTFYLYREKEFSDLQVTKNRRPKKEIENSPDLLSAVDKKEAVH